MLFTTTRNETNRWKVRDQRTCHCTLYRIEIMREDADKHTPDVRITIVG